MSLCLPKIALMIWFSVKIFDQLIHGVQPCNEQLAAALCNSKIDNPKCRLANARRPLP